MTIRLKQLFEVFFSKRASDAQQLLKEVTEKSCYVTFLNPYTLLSFAKTDIDFSQFDYICSDALFPVLLERIWGYKERKRISFDLGSFAFDLFNYSSTHMKKIFLWGTTDENLKMAKKLFEQNFTGMKIVGTENGFHSSEEEEAIIESILKESPDFIIIGQGVPKQDKLALTLKQKGFNGSVFTCGGFLHQTAMSSNGYYYPDWINRWNLRTPYRLCKERYILKRLIMFYIPFLFKYSYFLLQKSLKIQ